MGLPPRYDSLLHVFSSWQTNVSECIEMYLDLNQTKLLHSYQLLCYGLFFPTNFDRENNWLQITYFVNEGPLFSVTLYDLLPLLAASIRGGGRRRRRCLPLIRLGWLINVTALLWYRFTKFMLSTITGPTYLLLLKFVKSSKYCCDHFHTFFIFLKFIYYWDVLFTFLFWKIDNLSSGVVDTSNLRHLF